MVAVNIAVILAVLLLLVLGVRGVVRILGQTIGGSVGRKRENERITSLEAETTELRSRLEILENERAQRS